MSFRGNLLRAGIDSDGKIVTVYRQDGRLDVATASSVATGTRRSANITHTVGAANTGVLETFRVSLDSEYKTGSWANAIVGRIDYGDAGDSTGGMAAAICAEVNIAAKDMHNLGGAYYCFDAEINVPTDCVLPTTTTTRPVAFFNLAAWGDAVGEFDDKGFLFHTDGLTAGAGHLLSANTRTLRVNIEGALKYIYLSDTEDDLGAGVLDTLVLNPGRVATGSLAGVAATLGATYAYGSGMYLRYDVTDWTGKGNDFVGAYVRGEATTVTAAGKSMYGMQIYGSTQQTMTTGSLWGALIYAYKKGNVTATINNMYAVQAELTWDEDCGTTTITTEAAMILAKVTGGTLASYTVLHGAIFRFGDMNGADRTYGNGILIEDDAGMGGTATLTTGINISIGCTTGIYLDGTIATGIYMEPSAMTNGLRIGAPGTAVGTALPTGQGYDAAGAPVGIYFEDRTALTEWGESFTVGSVVTQNSTGGAQTGWPYTAFFYNNIHANITSATNQHWATVLINTALATGKTIDGFTSHGVSTLHLSVDINGTLAASNTMSNLSFGGNAAGTVTGDWVCMHVRDTTGNFSAFFKVDGNATGCYTESYTGNNAFVPNNKGTFTQTGQLRVIVNGNTVYIPYGTVA